MSTIEPVLEHRCLLGEGPVWDADRQRILWVDILRGEIHQYFTLTEKHNIFKAGQMVGAIALTKTGSLIGALHHGFYYIDLENEHLEQITDPEAHLPENRFNDGKCDPAGRFWAGTMSVTGKANAGKLYMLDTDHSVQTKIDGVSCSNGLAWSHDQKTFYYIDTGTQEVVAYDFHPANATIANKRTIIRIAPEEGYPDGMTIDSEGMLWVAIWGGGKVKRFNPATGLCIGEIHLPVTLVTSCTFGGPTLRDLYITTARTGLTDVELLAQPLAGSIFVVRGGCESEYAP